MGIRTVQFPRMKKKMMTMTTMIMTTSIWETMETTEMESNTMPLNNYHKLFKPIYSIYNWKVRGKRDLYMDFNVYKFLKIIEKSSSNATWYPTKNITYPPLPPFNDVQSDFPNWQQIPRFFNSYTKGNSTIIEFSALMKYTLYQVKCQLARFLRNPNAYMIDT